MKVTEFIKKKNAIIHKLTDITLVPEDQIKEVPKYYLDLNSGVTSCPYCHPYTNNDVCFGCPMASAGNQCWEHHNSTWEQLSNWVEKSTEYKFVHEWYQSIPEMVELYEKYNKQFKD